MTVGIGAQCSPIRSNINHGSKYESCKNKKKVFIKSYDKEPFKIPIVKFTTVNESFKVPEVKSNSKKAEYDFTKDIYTAEKLNEINEKLNSIAYEDYIMPRNKHLIKDKEDKIKEKEKLLKSKNKQNEDLNKNIKSKIFQNNNNNNNKERPKSTKFIPKRIFSGFSVTNFNGKNLINQLNINDNLTKNINYELKNINITEKIIKPETGLRPVSTSKYFSKLNILDYEDVHTKNKFDILQIEKFSAEEVFKNEEDFQMINHNYASYRRMRDDINTFSAFNQSPNNKNVVMKASFAVQKDENSELNENGLFSFSNNNYYKDQDKENKNKDNENHFNNEDNYNYNFINANSDNYNDNNYKGRNYDKNNNDKNLNFDTDPQTQTENNFNLIANDLMNRYNDNSNNNSPYKSPRKFHKNRNSLSYIEKIKNIDFDPNENSVEFSKIKFQKQHEANNLNNFEDKISNSKTKSELKSNLDQRNSLKSSLREFHSSKDTSQISKISKSFKLKKLEKKESDLIINSSDDSENDNYLTFINSKQNKSFDFQIENLEDKNYNQTESTKDLHKEKMRMGKRFRIKVKRSEEYFSSFCSNKDTKKIKRIQSANVKSKTRMIIKTQNKLVSKVRQNTEENKKNNLTIKTKENILTSNDIKNMDMKFLDMSNLNIENLNLNMDVEEDKEKLKEILLQEMIEKKKLVKEIEENKIKKMKDKPLPYIMNKLNKRVKLNAISNFNNINSNENIDGDFVFGKIKEKNKSDKERYRKKKINIEDILVFHNSTMRKDLNPLKTTDSKMKINLHLSSNANAWNNNNNMKFKSRPVSSAAGYY